ncbi:MAG: hypothetical protein A2Y61_03050 [Chloroflexi bacterium RBG_13_60_13]|nr:MAG: hypothetical protein A2Y61_03050 [Chloroflexi bacterium RBG_13_60_13]
MRFSPGAVTLRYPPDSAVRPGRVREARRRLNPIDVDGEIEEYRSRQMVGDPASCDDRRESREGQA